MSPALRMLVGILGGVLSIALIAVVSVLGVARQLPADLASLSAWESPRQTVVVDERGAVRGTLKVVESTTWPGDQHEGLIEAFIAAAPPSFYESQSRRATSLGPALRRAFGGESPPASALSIELARLLLAAEQPGPIRRVREDLVATWLDAEVSVGRRSIAWIDRAPICLGGRGLAPAADICLGKSLSALTLADQAALAVAATWRLDLAGDPAQIRMRRAQVLDELVVRGRLSSVEAAAFARSPIPAPRPQGPDAWVDVVSMGVRHRLGRGNETRSATIHTRLRWPLQERLREGLGAAAWMALTPDDGAVVSLGGDILGRTRRGNPSVGDVVAWATAVVAQASASGRLPTRPVQAVRPLWLDRVVLEADERRGREEVLWDGATDPLGGFARHPLLRLPPIELLGVESLAELPLEGALRKARVAGVELRLHGDLVVGWSGTSSAGLDDAVNGVAFSRPERYAWTTEQEPGPDDQ